VDVDLRASGQAEPLAGRYYLLPFIIGLDGTPCLFNIEHADSRK
jgi:hypothetical protein